MLVLLDMDGVVSDFDAKIMEIYSKPMERMSWKEKNKFWDIDCVSYRFFANSKPIPEGIELASSLLLEDIDVSILTSTGGGKQHAEIAKQKIDFLVANGLGHLPMYFATGTQCKAKLASQGNILIDDREKVVNAFKERGERAFLFKRNNWQDILEAVKLLVHG